MPLVFRRVIPLAFWYILLIGLAIVLDLFLHWLRLFWVGRYLGFCGTILLLLSFAYSLRKRKLINFGSPKGLLNAHEYLSWAGVLMILVHAGWHFHAILPWLAVFLMLVVVASGFTGKFLLREARERLASRKLELQQSAGVSKRNSTTGYLVISRFCDGGSHGEVAAFSPSIDRHLCRVGGCPHCIHSRFVEVVV